MTSLSAPSRERTIRNIFFSIASQILILGTSFFTTPFIVQKLGPDAYGVVVLISTVLSYMGFMDLGLGSATIRYLTECAFTNDWERFRQILWSALLTYSGIGLAGGMVFFVLIPPIVSSWLNVPPDIRSATLIALYTLIPVFVVVLIMQIPQAIVWAHNRIDLAAVLNLFNGVLQPVGTIFMVFLGYGIIGVSIATLIANVVTLILSLWTAKRLFGDWGKPAYNIHIMRPLFVYGSWINIAHILSQLVQSLDKVFIGSCISAAAVGYYNLSVVIPLKLWIIHGSFASSAFPLIVSLKTRASPSTEIFHLVSRFLRSVQLLLLPAVLFFALWGDTFLSVWINEEVAQHGNISIRLASIAMLITGLNGIHHIFLRAWGRADLSAKVYIGNAIGYIPILYLFIRWLGISGAGLGLVMYSVIETFLVLIIIKKLVNIPISAWFPIILNRHVFILAAIGIPIMFLQYLLPWGTLWKLAVSGGGFLMLSSAYVWFIGFSKLERESVIKTLIRRFV